MTLDLDLIELRAGREPMHHSEILALVARVRELEADLTAERAISDALAEREHEAQKPVVIELLAMKARAEKAERERDELRAARVAYASEFPPDAEGEPDVGSIHLNIRNLKARVQALEAALRKAERDRDEARALVPVGGRVPRRVQALRASLREAEATVERYRVVHDDARRVLTALCDDDSLSLDEAVGLVEDRVRELQAWEEHGSRALSYVTETSPDDATPEQLYADVAALDDKYHALLDKDGGQ